MGFSPWDFLLLQRLYTRRVNLSDLWARLRRPSPSDEDEMPFSMVLLLRRSSLFTEDELNAAGQRAWNVPFSHADKSMYCVMPATPNITLIKSGNYLFNLIQEDSFYLGPIEEIAPQLPRPEQQLAWRQHTSWAAWDLMNKDVTKKEAYAVIARWVIELVHGNCVGVYLPKESLFFPNNGPAEDKLRKYIKKGPA